MADAVWAKKPGEIRMSVRSPESVLNFFDNLSEVAQRSGRIVFAVHEGL
jgi:hypothetical protein